MSNFNKLIDRFDRFFLYYLGKATASLGKPARKFYIDMVYGIIKSQSVILSDIAHELKEGTTPKKTIERLSRSLDRDVDAKFREGLLSLALSMMPSGLKTFAVDDTDVIKPYGKSFESLGTVRDASSPKGSLEKGYRVTCVTAMTASKKHPMPVFCSFHSETEPGFKSVNDHTFRGLESVFAKLADFSGVFVFDRGYDDYKVMNFVSKHKQYFVIRVTKNRKIRTKRGKTGLIDEGKRKKGKIVIPVTYKGCKQTARASHSAVKLLNGRQYYAVYCYMGDSFSEPMTLLTNRPIKSKEDVISVVMNYVSRWKIEEQFRFKKNGFGFEGFRVRTLKRINNLALCLDAAITLLSVLIERGSALLDEIIALSKSLKGDDAYIRFYQVLSGIKTLLGHKEKGIRSKEGIEHRGKPKQLTLF